MHDDHLLDDYFLTLMNVDALLGIALYLTPVESIVFRGIVIGNIANLLDIVDDVAVHRF